MGILRDNLQPTDFADAVCRVSSWKTFGFHGYSENRVWLCRCGGHWFQRHEWAEDGKNQTRIDPWIYAGYSITRKFPPSMFHDGLKLIEEAA